MADPLERVNRAIRDGEPALYRALSPLGKRVVFPPDIPAQAAEARGKSFNASIGQITDGEGGAVPLAPMAAALAGLAGGDRDRAFLYSPVEGIRELRQRWRARQRRHQAPERPSTLPLVTVGLTHGLSLLADLFAGEDRAVVLPSPFWGNYRGIFATRTGARLVAAPAYRNGRFRPLAVTEALAELPGQEPALAILNFPSNPGGYSPTAAERRTLVSSLIEAAARRVLLVVCDDAYAGLVYEEGIPRESVFWELAGAHPNLIPVKVDGATKEFSFFGGRIGFLTFPLPPDSPVAGALESKVKSLVRAGVGSPVAASQMIVLAALRDGAVEEKVEGIRRLLEGRYRALREALQGSDPGLFRALPCNSGCFALLELRQDLGLGSEAVRRHLLESQDVGIISVPPRYLRIAFCSVDAERLPELIRRLQRGVEELAAQRRPRT